jgi:hypothetical protein
MHALEENVEKSILREEQLLREDVGPDADPELLHRAIKEMRLKHEVCFHLVCCTHSSHSYP